MISMISMIVPDFTTFGGGIMTIMLIMPKNYIRAKNKKLFQPVKNHHDLHDFHDLEKR